MGTRSDSSGVRAFTALVTMTFLAACSRAEPADVPDASPPPSDQPAGGAPATIPQVTEIEAATRWLAGPAMPSSEGAIAEALGAKATDVKPDAKVRGRKVTYLLPGEGSTPCFLHRTRKTGEKVDVTVRVRKSGCDDAQVTAAREALAQACAKVGGKLSTEGEWTYRATDVARDESLSCETKGEAAPAAPVGVTFDLTRPFEATADRWSVQLPWGTSGTAEVRIERWKRADGQELWEVSRTAKLAEADEGAFAAAIAKISPSGRMATSKTLWVTGQTTAGSAAAPAGQSPPPPPADDWKGLDALRPDQILGWKAEDPNKFGTGHHGKLLSVVAKKCSEAMARAQWRQDTVLQMDSNAHFDNCAFAGSIAYIDRLLAEADAKVGKANPTADDAIEAMDLLGRALHGIQDFYSHTNWIELKAARNAPFGSTLVVPVWTPAGKKEVMDLAAKGDLYSGRVWWGTPKHCPASVPTHGAMAKDSESDPAGKMVLTAWGRTGYRAASDVASSATTAFLRDMFTRWPLLKKHCGPVVHVLPPLERRADPQ